MYMPDQQKEGDGAPGSWGFCTGERLVLNQSPDELEDACDEEGKEHKQDQGGEIGIR